MLKEIQRLTIQMARENPNRDDGILCDHRVLICDRDTKWSLAFRRLLADVGIRIWRSSRPTITTNEITKDSGTG